MKSTVRVVTGAILALVCMLIPTFKLKEREFVDVQPTTEKSNTVNSGYRTFQKFTPALYYSKPFPTLRYQRSLFSNINRCHRHLPIFV